jgi:hypothetical protein
VLYISIRLNDIDLEVTVREIMNKLRNEAFHIVFSSPDIIKMDRSRTVRSTCMEQTRN